MEAAHANWLDPDASVKDEVDVLKAALREIKRGKNVAYNKKEGKKNVAAALKVLGKTSDQAAAEADWDWLADNRGDKAFAARQAAFLERFKTPLAELMGKHKQSQATYWLKNTPSQVMDVVIAAADSDMPADQLYCYAAREGLIDYVRDELGLGKNDEPTQAQLAGVSTSKAVSGFDYLGVDDFWTDMSAKREALSGHLPSGYDLTKVSHEARTNEKGRVVDSAKFPDLLTGVQGLAAYLKRRRKLFLADVATYGYAAPTDEELVYWTYVYFNVGEFNGQLKKYKGKRKLGDWIAKKEYDNAMKVLESYRVLKSMKIF